MLKIFRLYFDISQKNLYLQFIQDKKKIIYISIHSILVKFNSNFDGTKKVLNIYLQKTTV